MCQTQCNRFTLNIDNKRAAKSGRWGHAWELQHGLHVTQIRVTWLCEDWTCVQVEPEPVFCQDWTCVPEIKSWSLRVASSQESPSLLFDLFPTMLSFSFLKTLALLTSHVHFFPCFLPATLFTQNGSTVSLIIISGTSWTVKWKPKGGKRREEFPF